MTTSAADLFDQAATHLDAAAALPDQTDDDPILGAAFAGQIRLAAATLPGEAHHGAPGPPTTRRGGSDVTGHLRAALDALDQVHPRQGPPDLPLCAWHVHELLRIAATRAAGR